jgi:prepilin peptidase CpaA
LVKPSDFLVIATVAGGSGTAAAIDLRARRVPNPLILLLASSGVAFAALGLTELTLGASLVGLALGLALMLPGHVFGATGAGDVKLFAALGALVGPTHIAVAFVYTAIAGGVLALVVAIHRRRLRQTLDGAARVIVSARAAAASIESPLEHNRFAFAPAIAVGATLAALGL